MNNIANPYPARPDEPNLCLECGLCCNGVIFADVKLQPRDKPAELRSLGLRLTKAASKTDKTRLEQPCAAFVQGRCRIYARRPGCCRDFECLLLKNVKAGRIKVSAARSIIATALERAETVRSLLRDLGNDEEETALGKRFRSTAKRLEQSQLDESTAGIYGELTLAVHDLNLLIKDAFYP